MFGALAEFERDLICEPTEADINAAGARGRKGLRPKLLSPERRKLVGRRHEERQHSVVEICRLMGISKPTLYS